MGVKIVHFRKIVLVLMGTRANCCATLLAFALVRTDAHVRPMVWNLFYSIMIRWTLPNAGPGLGLRRSSFAEHPDWES